MITIDEINKLDKDGLADFALSQFDTKLNKRKKLDTLQTEVAALMTTVVTHKVKEEKKSTNFLRHPINGRVFVATEILLKRGDMIPCDQDGNEQ